MEEDLRKFSVRTLSDLESFRICGQYHGLRTLDAHCTDEDMTSHVLEVQLKDGFLKLSPVQTSISDDLLKMDGPKPTIQWTLYIRSARDRYEQNMEVVKDSQDSDKVYLRTIRNVSRGEELFVWYSDELGMEMSIPILTPSHIRGHQQYTCNLCPTSFRSPNPLKAHLRSHNHPSWNNFQDSSTTTELNPINFQSGLQPSGTQAELRGDKISKPNNLSSEEISNKRKRKRSAFDDSEKSPKEISQSPLDLAPYRPYDPAFSFSQTQKKEHSPSDFRQAPHRHHQSCDGNNPATTLPFYNPFLFHPVALAVLPPVGFASPLPHAHPYGGIYSMLQLPSFNDRSKGFSDRVYPPADYHWKNPLMNPLMKNPLTLMSSKSNPCGSNNSNIMANDPVGKVELGEIFLENPDMQDCEESDMMPKLIYTSGSKSKNGYLCIYCGKLYSRKYGLKIHVRTHTGFKPLKCKVCLRPFGDPSNLNKHIRLHAEGETPYRCPHCGKVLVRRRDLERHIRSRHSNESICDAIDNQSLDENHPTVTSSDYLSDDQLIDVDDEEDIGV